MACAHPTFSLRGDLPAAVDFDAVAFRGAFLDVALALVEGKPLPRPPGLAWTSLAEEGDGSPAAADAGMPAASLRAFCEACQRLVAPRAAEVDVTIHKSLGDYIGSKPLLADAARIHAFVEPDWATLERPMPDGTRRPAWRVLDARRERDLAVPRHSSGREE